MGEHLILGILIFTISYIMIVSEKINRTIVALLGGTLMIILDIVTQETALEHIDFNTIGLLIGMMLIVNIVKKTGLFQYMAIKTATIAKGNPIKIILYFSIITAIASGLLDNVTTILLIVPVSIVIADELKISPIPFIIAEIMSANIGGAATLIGDPPNIMIGSSVEEIGFVDFIVNLGPLMVIIFIITIVIIQLIYRKSLVVKEEDKQNILSMDANKAIRNKTLLIKSLIILGLTIAGFFVAEFAGIETATVALFGAAVLLLLSKIEPEEILVDVEWETIFFFGGLFVLVGALQSIGVIKYLADNLLTITKGDLTITTQVVLWLSAILSSFLDNIPYVATMIPLVHELSDTMSNVEPVWWALSIGACLGGNGTIIGASANVVARGIVERHNYKISFMGYMKIAYPLMLLSIAVATVYMFVVYL